MNLNEALKNSKGQIFYGMHFYPGVAQYDPPDEKPFRVFINESTIRQMSPSFAGRPVFVEHVAGVDDDVNIVRGVADGWVIESFFNEADGKTWAKFIIVSDQGFSAIRKGFRLSNAYLPQLTDTKATWNGVDYQKEVVGGEFEHLAIVNNPRYEESVIMSPEEFKAYNSKLKTELVRLANSKGEPKMGLTLFKRQKIENSLDLETTMVALPKSKKEMSITQLVNDHDTFLNMQGYASGDHMVKVNDMDEMSVNDLVKSYQTKCNEMEDMKKNAAGDEGGEPGKGKDGIDPQVENEEEISIGGEGARDDNGDLSLDNVEDEGKGVKKEGGDKNGDKMKNEAKARAARLANAQIASARSQMPTARIDLASDKVARGRDRYGSK